MNITECKSLTERLEAKRLRGLVDVKFYVDDHAGVAPDQVYAEAAKLQAAIETPSLVESFRFNDRHVQ